MDADDGLSGWFIGSNDLAGVYTYACQDTKYGDFYYLFRYQAFWMRPAAMALLHAVSARVWHSSARARVASAFGVLVAMGCRSHPIDAPLNRQVSSLMIKMLLMHTYASLFMLLAQVGLARWEGPGWNRGAPDALVRHGRWACVRVSRSV